MKSLRCVFFLAWCISFVGKAVKQDEVVCPDIIHTYVGEDLHMNCNITKVGEVEWYHKESGRTVITIDSQNRSHVNDFDYTGRVDQLPGAGFILRNVTKADEGTYSMNGRSTHTTHTTRVRVYNVPQVEVDNEDVIPGAMLNKSHTDLSSVTVLSDSIANITIELNGVVLESCQDDRLCTAIVQLDKFPSTTLPLHISVNNGEGDRLELKYNITNERGHVVEPNSSPSKTTVILIIITVLLVLVIIVMLFIILCKSKRETNVPGRVADPPNNPELEHLTGRNEKDGDAKPETGKEIIEESDKKECDVSVSIQEEGSEVPENNATDETVHDKKSDHVEDESNILIPDSIITFDNSINVINPENGISSPSSVTDQDGPVIHT